MGIVRSNTLTEGLSGRVGGLVYKNYGSVTLVTSRPGSPRTQSEQQRTNRSKFREATQWAKGIMQDASRKEYYKKKATELGLTNAYTAAITEYMRKPKVEEISEAEDTVTYGVSKKCYYSAIRYSSQMKTKCNERRSKMYSVDEVCRLRIKELCQLRSPATLADKASVSCMFEQRCKRCSNMQLYNGRLQTKMQSASYHPPASCNIKSTDAPDVLSQ